MALFTSRQWPFWHHQLIRSQWRRWLLPTLLMLPYAASLIWLQQQGLVWLVQIMLAPLVMGLVIGLMTWLLARLEFRGAKRRL